MGDSPTAPPGALRRARDAAFAAIVFVAAGGVFFWPTLGPSRWAYGGDTVGHDLIAEAYGWSLAWSEGALPWNAPHLRAGQPAMGSAAFAPFYPPNLLLALASKPAADASAWGPNLAPPPPAYWAGVFVDGALPIGFAHTLQWPLHLAMAAWFLAMALRARGLGWAASCLGGFAFAFSGHVATLTYAGHLAKVQAIAWAPAALWGVEAAERRRREAEAGRSAGSPLLPLAGTAAALAMMWLAGHPQIWAISAALIVALETARAAARWFDARRERRVGDSTQASAPGGEPVRSSGAAGARSSLAHVAFAIGAAALSLALAAPMAMALAEFAPLSNRAGQTLEEAAKSSYPPEELWELAIPRAAGDSLPTNLGGTRSYRGRWGERIVSDYLGLPLLTLALAGLVFGTGRWRAFWIGAFAATTLFGLGAYLGPLHRFLYVWLPGFRLFRSPATAMFVMALAASILAAQGLDALLRLDAPPSRARAWTFLLLVALLTLLTLSQLPLNMLEPHMTDGRVHTLLARAHLASKRHATIAGLLALALAASWLRFGVGANAKRRLLLVGATLVVVAWDLWATTTFFIRPAPAEEAFRSGVKMAAFLAEERRALDAAGDPRRADIAALATIQAPPPSILVRGRELSLWPMLAGWRVPHGYHPIAHGALDARMKELGYDNPEFLAALDTRLVVEGPNLRSLAPPGEGAPWRALGASTNELLLQLEPPGAKAQAEWIVPLVFDRAWRVHALDDAPAAIEALPALGGLATALPLDGAPPPKPLLVALRFEPRSRRWGPSIMAVAWLALGAFAISDAIRRRRRASDSSIAPRG